MGEGPILKYPHFKKTVGQIAGQKMVVFFTKILMSIVRRSEVAQQSTVVYSDELSGWGVESQR